MYDDKSVEAWGETWRSWENDDDDQCALNDETILPESVSWFRWVDKLKSRPDAALPTCTDDQELLSYVLTKSWEFDSHFSQDFFLICLENSRRILELDSGQLFVQNKETCVGLKYVIHN